MAIWANLSCVTDLINVKNPCVRNTTSIFWFDDNGLSLATTAKAADDRYVTGQNMVDQKIRIALNDVMAHLTRNVTVACDLDITNGVICSYAQRIARAVWYKATALIFKEIAVDSQRYNELIQFSASEALAQMVYYDSSLAVFTNMDKVNSGLYQIELDRLEPVRTQIEQICCVECVGSQWSITIP